MRLVTFLTRLCDWLANPLVEKTSSASRFVARHIDSDGSVISSVALNCATSNNEGVYSIDATKWIVYMNPQGAVFLNGTKFKVDNDGTTTINGNVLSDWVVEEGTSGIWRYRKWKSGISECWGQSGTISKAFTTSLGTGYYAPKYSVAYPSGLFTGTPVVSASLYDGGAVLGWVAIATNNTSTVEVYPGSLLSVTKNVQIHFSVYGRWK